MLTSRDNRWLKEFRVALRGGLPTESGAVGVEGARLVEDAEGRPVGLFDGDWSLNYMTENNPRLRFVDIAAEEFETADERR